MGYVIAPPPPVAAMVVGTDDTFPVRRIYCIGRNYAEHVREMGFDPDRDPPFFFQKPADALTDGATPIPYARDTENFHHEAELVMAIGVGGVDIAVADALDHVFGYAVGVDLTRRDRQAEARKNGRPWEIAKSFDRSAPMGPIHPATGIGHPASGRIWLTVDGAIRQDSDLDQLIWSPAEIVAILSRSFRLAPGDLIFTGTPAGVGPLVVGDAVEVGIDGLGTLRFAIAAAEEN